MEYLEERALVQHEYLHFLSKHAVCENVGWVVVIDAQGFQLCDDAQCE